jgi:hypothetical protein
MDPIWIWKIVEGHEKLIEARYRYFVILGTADASQTVARYVPGEIFPIQSAHPRMGTHRLEPRAAVRFTLSKTFGFG